MNDTEEPRSLRDDPEATPMLLSLLDQAREDELDAAAVERLVLRVDALGPTPARVPPSPFNTLLFVGIGVALVALLTTALFLFYAQPAPAPNPTQTHESETQEVEVEAPEVQASEVEIQTPDVEVQAPEVQTPETTEEHPSRVVNEGSEGALLLAARRALLSSNARRALALTREHERRFAEGAMEEEREVIAIEALLRLEQRERAQARRARFETQHPSSPYRNRIDALFGQAEVR